MSHLGPAGSGLTPALDVTHRHFGHRVGAVVSDFEPTIDLPEYIDQDDWVVASSARSRDASVQKKRKSVLRWLMIGMGLVIMAAGYSPVRTIIGVAFSYLILTGDLP